MNNYVPQILNDDLDAFSLSDFHYQPLVLVSTAGAGCAFMLTAIPGSHCFQPLESMITSISTISCRQQAFTSEFAPFADLSLNLNQGQGSLQIPPFCSRIEN